MLTRDQIEQALPPNLKSAATQALADQINGAVSDPIVAEQIRENFINYTIVLREGKFKIQDYLNAVKYVSFRLMGYNNQESYARTFPQRYQDLVARGATTKDISAYVSAYNRGKLVNLVYEQTLVPTWVLNQENYQKAINTQVELMTHSESDYVRTQAANSLLTHLAKPKEAAPLINVDMRETSGMNEMKELLLQLATKQQELISSGVSPKEIAGQALVEKEE